MKKILIIHGPNLNLLGTRETNIYGRITLESINKILEDEAVNLGVEISTFQSNHEGEIVQKIQDAKKDGFCAFVINPAAYTHTSVAIRDAIAAVNVPTIEVHLSNIYSREDFRKISLISPVAMGVISGFGQDSYLFGLRAAAGIAKKI
ncbi:MAG: type II 3-dehydroquinate dehydratase [Candidatus Omnitrophica bacterium]|nr:type II 3-dehydroquinate dehydratase [Candidatus Omnitrophota bacterium]